jgi:hypothetical protein
MGRRTSGQTVGLQSIGNIQASANTLTTTQANQGLTIDPNGAGAVEIVASVTVNGDMSITNQGDLRLLEASGSGTNYIAQQAAATMSANYTVTWPAAVSSTNGFVLTSDTSGNLSWASAGGNIPVSDPGSTATEHFLFFGTASGSLPTTLSPLARTNLKFVPSTGELTSTIGSFANVYGSTANSGTVTIRGTTSATKAAASVLLTDGVASSSTTSGTLVVTGGVGISGRLSAASAVIEGVMNALIPETNLSSSYTLALTDRDTTVGFTGSGAQTVTIPTDAAVAFPIGSVVYIARFGSGSLTLAAAGGVTVTKTGTFSLNEEIKIRKRAANSWSVIESPQNPTGTGGSLTSADGYRVHSYTGVGGSTFVIS